MRKTSANKISLEKEEILAIYMRKIFLELKLKSMLMLQNNSYGLEESFSSGQREFSFKIKKLNEIIDKYQAYLADAHKIILEANHPKLVLPASQTEKNYWVKAFSKNNQKTYIQWFGIGLLIGMLGVVFNNAIGYYLVKSENKSK